MLRIITTVGASLFNNLPNNISVKVKGPWQVLRKKDSGDKDILIDGNTYNINPQIKQIRQEWLQQQKLQEIIRYAECSAETATLEKINRETECKENYEVFLLCTETYLSRLAAELLATYNPLLKGKTRIINGDGRPVDVSEGKVIPKLSIHDAQDLKAVGLANLVAEIQAIWRLQFDCTSKKDHTFVINASGGYKGIIPFLTLIGQLYDIPMYYKYQEENEENQQQLIKVDALPFGFNRELVYEIAPYLDQKRVKNERSDPHINGIIKEMEKMKLIDERDDMLTDVGMVLKAFYEGAKVAMIEEVDRHTPAGKYRSSAAANLAEFKFFEWRSMVPYESNGREYALVSRSSGNNYNLQLKKHEEKFLQQIDIAMESVNGDGFILGEVKYAYWIGNELAQKHKARENPHANEQEVRKAAQGIDGILNQIINRLGECDKLPDEFHIYTYSALPMSENDQTLLVNRINKIDQAFRNRDERYSNLILKAFYCPVGTNPKTITDTSVDEINAKTEQIYFSESHS